MQQPGVTIRSNHRAVQERCSAYLDDVTERFELLKHIADAMDEQGVVVSDLVLLQALTQGEITVRVTDLAKLLGINLDEATPFDEAVDDGGGS